MNRHRGARIDNQVFRPLRKRLDLLLQLVVGKSDLDMVDHTANRRLVVNVRTGRTQPSVARRALMGQILN